MKRIRRYLSKRRTPKKSRETPSLAKDQLNWHEGDFTDFVEHPRFGRYPIRTGLNPETSFSGGVYLHWHSDPSCRIPFTAVIADTTKQNQPTVAVTHYYDSKRHCRDCKQPFIFFAQEQRYWYETLQFPLTSDCVRCVNCRQQERILSKQRAEYERLIQLDSLEVEERLNLVALGLNLVEHGLFGDRVLAQLTARLNQLPAPLADDQLKLSSELRTKIDEMKLRNQQL